MNSARIQPPYHQRMLNACFECPAPPRLKLLEGAKGGGGHLAVRYGVLSEEGTARGLEQDFPRLADGPAAT